MRNACNRLTVCEHTAKLKFCQNSEPDYDNNKNNITAANKPPKLIIPVRWKFWCSPPRVLHTGRHFRLYRKRFSIPLHLMARSPRLEESSFYQVLLATHTFCIPDRFGFVSSGQTSVSSFFKLWKTKIKRTKSEYYSRHGCVVDGRTEMKRMKSDFPLKHKNLAARNNTLPMTRSQSIQPGSHSKCMWAKRGEIPLTSITSQCKQIYNHLALTAVILYRLKVP